MVRSEWYDQKRPDFSRFFYRHPFLSWAIASLAIVRQLSFHIGNISDSMDSRKLSDWRYQLLLHRWLWLPFLELPFLHDCQLSRARKKIRSAKRRVRPELTSRSSLMGEMDGWMWFRMVEGLAKWWNVNQIQSRSMWQKNDYASNFDVSWEKVAIKIIIVGSHHKQWLMVKAV